MADSYPPPASRLVRRFSQQLRSKWTEAYTDKIQKLGQADLKAQIKFEKVDNFDLEDQIQTNECILLLPQITKRIGKNKKIILNDNTDGGDDKKERNTEQVKKTEFTAYRLPLLYPSIGYPCIDIRALKGVTGVTTYDPGFMSTSSCHSAITYIDGPNGRLLHRGYEIQELCDKSDFVDLSFLLMYGELPGKNDRIHHETQIKKHSMVHEKLIEV